MWEATSVFGDPHQQESLKISSDMLPRARSKKRSKKRKLDDRAESPLPSSEPGDAEGGESTADLFNELAARHAEDSAAAAA